MEILRTNSMGRASRGRIGRAKSRPVLPQHNYLPNGRYFLLVAALFAAMRIASAEAPSALSCVALARNLSFGFRGNEVVKLQRFLIAQNFLAGGNDTGYFGKFTEAAVQTYQRSKNIVSTGTPKSTGYGAVGPRTRRAISACPLPAPASSGAATSSTTPSETTTPPPVSLPITYISPLSPTPPQVETLPPPYTLSVPILVASRERTPLGQKYKDGSIILQAGTQKKTWSGSGWATPSIKGAYTQGSTHATISLDDNSMLAFDFGTPINFNGTTKTWLGKYLQYFSPLGDLKQSGTLSVDILPGNSTGENYEPLTLATSPNYVYMALQRMIYRPESWTRADGAAGTGYGYLCESYMSRSSVNDPANFKFRGTIGTKNEYVSALQNRSLSFQDVPLYYACTPRCIALSDEKLICALRGSADDDDGYRPMDPSKIFYPPYEVQQAGAFDSNKIVPGIYAPAVLPNKFYLPKNTAAIPPLLLSISGDGGLSWKTKLIAERGGVDSSFAYDAANNILVITYGALTYPRKGVAVQWSRDYGETWSDPITISDGYTTGTVFAANTSSKQFEIVYDSLDYYTQYNPVSKSMINDGYNIYSRTLNSGRAC